MTFFHDDMGPVTMSNGVKGWVSHCKNQIHSYLIAHPATNQLLREIFQIKIKAIVHVSDVEAF
jgi:hypothetical protein